MTQMTSENGAAAASRYSVVIPCFNEEMAVEKTVRHLRESLGDPSRYDLIFVNDGSTDRTGAILTDLSAQDPGIIVVHHSRNRGYGAALKSGIRRATSPLIVITDADGTYPNERIPELVERASSFDMVVGARTGEGVTYPLIRKIPKFFLIRYAAFISGQSIPDMNSGLRVFRKAVAERFLHILPDSFSFTTTITLAMLTNFYEVEYVPISYSMRIGRSKIKPIRDTLRFIQLIMRTGMYFAPLRVFMPIAGVLTVLGTINLLLDVFVRFDVTDVTILLFLFAMNTSFFALLADMVDKRTAR